MTARARATWQLSAAVWVVLILAVIGGGRHPLYIDVMAYAASALAAATLTAHVIDWLQNRRPEKN